MFIFAQVNFVAYLSSNSISHWYLKQTLFRAANTGQALESVMWHPEKPMSLFVLTSVDVEQRNLAWQTYASNRKVPYDSGAVAVMDGCKLLKCTRN